MPSVISSWESGAENNKKAVYVTIRNFQMIVDHPKEQGGTDLGPTPSEILLSALVGCFTGTLRTIARALSIPIDSVKIIAEAEKGEREYESLRSIRLKVEIQPRIEDDIRFKYLMEQTKRNCTISNTLSHSPEITITRS